MHRNQVELDFIPVTPDPSGGVGGCSTVRIRNAFSEGENGSVVFRRSCKTRQGRSLEAMNYWLVEVKAFIGAVEPENEAARRCMRSARF